MNHRTLTLLIILLSISAAVGYLMGSKLAITATSKTKCRYVTEDNNAYVFACRKVKA